jgi:hypothetical protein
MFADCFMSELELYHSAAVSNNIVSKEAGILKYYFLFLTIFNYAYKLKRHCHKIVVEKRP